MKLRFYTGMMLVVALFFASCGGGNKGTAADIQTQQQQIAALEAAGKIPQLDRSSSLAGPDTDSNGVRDDIDKFIAAKALPNSQTLAAKQLARAIQATLVVDTSREASLEANSQKMVNAVECLHDQMHDTQAASQIGDELQRATVNTKVRTEAYIKYQIARNGSVLPSPLGESCEN